MGAGMGGSTRQIHSFDCTVSGTVYPIDVRLWGEKDKCDMPY